MSQGSHTTRLNSPSVLNQACAQRPYPNSMNKPTHLLTSTNPRHDTEGMLTRRPRPRSKPCLPFTAMRTSGGKATCRGMQPQPLRTVTVVSQSSNRAAASTCRPWPVRWRQSCAKSRRETDAGPGIGGPALRIATPRHGQAAYTGSQARSATLLHARGPPVVLFIAAGHKTNHAA